MICTQLFIFKPGSLEGLSTRKKPPLKTTMSGIWASNGACAAASWQLWLMFSVVPAACAAFSDSAACCLAFSAAFAAARRDFASTLVAVGLAGAAAGFCSIKKYVHEIIHFWQRSNAGYLIKSLYLYFLQSRWGFVHFHPAPGLGLFESIKLFVDILNLK